MLSKLKLKRTLALLLLISFVPFSIQAQEQTGKYTRLLKGQPSPFDSWCFDDYALAVMKAKFETMQEACELGIKKAVEQEQAKFTLKLNNLQLRLDTLKKESDNIILIKDEEIKKLQEAALKRPGDYSMWWATGGVAVGVLATLAIMFAVK